MERDISSRNTPGAHRGEERQGWFIATWLDSLRRHAAGAPVLVAFVAAGVLFVVRLAVHLSPQGHALHPQPWIRAQQSFTYEQEFIRRGLIGEILRLLSYPNRDLPMFWLSTIALALLAALLGVIAWRSLSAVSLDKRYLVTILVLIAPFSLPQFAYDIGRTDALLYVIVLPVVVWPNLARVNPILFLIVGLTGVLIHEAFIFVQLPVLLFAILRNSNSSIVNIVTNKRTSGVILGCVVGIMIVSLEGQMESVTEGDFARELEAGIPGYDAHWDRDEWGAGDVPAHHMLYTDTGYAVERSLRTLATGKPLLEIVAALVPGLLMLWACRRYCSNGVRPSSLVVVVAPVCVLFVVGIDVARWVSLASFNAMVVLLLHVGEQSTLKLVQKSHWPFVILALTVLLGPMGIGEAFPWWRQILETVLS